MILSRKKSFLKLVEVVLDDDRALDIARHRADYDHINIVSYNQLSLGADFKVKEKQSARIILQNDINLTLQTFDSTTRKHIRRTFKIENLNFKMLDNDLASTYRAYVEFEKANGRTPFAKDAFEGLLLFNAYNGAEVISSVLCYDTIPALKAHSIFSKRLKTEDREKYKTIAYATRRLVYEMCQFAINGGYSTLDLGSVNFQDEKKSGITNFKMTFNPKIESEYHYIYQSRKFKLANKIKKLFFR